jgi:hypothetical protein
MFACIKSDFNKTLSEVVLNYSQLKAIIIYIV